MTPKQKKFIEEYLVDLNATQAAIRAGYSKKTAKIIASQNLTKLNIKEAIEKAMEKRSRRTELTQDRVLEEMACLGLSNIKDYMKVGTDKIIVFKNIDDITEEQARAIESIKVDVKQGKIEFKLYSKTKTIEMIGRHLGMFIDKFDVGDNLKDLLIKRIFTDERPEE